MYISDMPDDTNCPILVIRDSCSGGVWAVFKKRKVTWHVSDNIRQSESAVNGVRAGQSRQVGLGDEHQGQAQPITNGFVSG